MPAFRPQLRRTEARPADKMQVAMDIERLHFFDPETSASIGLPAAEEKAVREEQAEREVEATPP